MDHFKILKRAWNITWNYRALWLFGIILALTAGGFPNPGNRNEIRYEIGKNDLNNLSPDVMNAVIGIGIALACLVIILAIVGTILHYVSQTALIRMVNDHEDKDIKITSRQGFRLGWSRAAFRLFLINLLVGLVTMVAFLLGLAIAAAPLLLLLTETRILSIIGVLLAVGLFLVLVAVFIVAAIAINLAMQMAFRACVLDGLGVIDSIKRGWLIFRKRLGDILIMGLILFALGVAVSIVMIPVFFALLMAGAVIAGLPALTIGWIVSLFASGEWPWIIAAIVGVPLLLLVLGIPLTLIEGIIQTFVSSTWTLTYRETVAMNHLQPNGTASQDLLPDPTI